jgi:hypothetical protein
MPDDFPVCGELLIFPESAIRHTQVTQTVRGVVDEFEVSTLRWLRRLATPKGPRTMEFRPLSRFSVGTAGRDETDALIHRVQHRHQGTGLGGESGDDIVNHPRVPSGAGISGIS